jgi:hypothetical protein
MAPLACVAEASVLVTGSRQARRKFHRLAKTPRPSRGSGEALAPRTLTFAVFASPVSPPEPQPRFTRRRLRRRKGGRTSPLCGDRSQAACQRRRRLVRPPNASRFFSQNRIKWGTTDVFPLGFGTRHAGSGPLAEHGHLGNVIESTKIGGRRSDRFMAGKLSPSNFGLLQHYLP